MTARYVLETTRGQTRINHPMVGELSLDWDAYPIPDPALVVFTAAETSLDGERPQLLAGLLPTSVAPA